MFKTARERFALARDWTKNSNNIFDLRETTAYCDDFYGRLDLLGGDPLLPEMNEWLNDNIYGEWEQHLELICFEKDRDAIIFRLRWF